LFAAFGGKPVKLGAAIVFGGAGFDGNPFALDEPVECRIEGALLNLQDVVGVELDGFGDGVAVGGPEEQSAQNEQVERALEQLDAIDVLFSRHSR